MVTFPGRSRGVGPASATHTRGTGQSGSTGITRTAAVWMVRQCELPRAATRCRGTVDGRERVGDEHRSANGPGGSGSGSSGTWLDHGSL